MIAARLVLLLILLTSSSNAANITSSICKAISADVSKIKALSTATLFCSSLLHISPVVTTQTGTASMVTVTGSVSTVTAYSCAANQKRAAALDLPELGKRMTTKNISTSTKTTSSTIKTTSPTKSTSKTTSSSPPRISGLASALISSACSCLYLTTSTHTIKISGSPASTVSVTGATTATTTTINAAVATPTCEAELGHNSEGGPISTYDIYYVGCGALAAGTDLFTSNYRNACAAVGACADAAAQQCYIAFEVYALGSAPGVYTCVGLSGRATFSVANSNVREAYGYDSQGVSGC